MFTAADSPYDLPLYPRLKQIVLDAAHDAMPFYRYFASQGTIPFIDLNRHQTGQKKDKDDLALSPEGVPICQKGLEMKDNGYDRTRGRRKYRCPLVQKGVCTCDSPCSDSSYGRCVYTYTKDNPRLFPPVARHSDEWNNVYKRRTTVERSNKREKIDYKREAGKHRSTKMWLIRLFCIMMCQHLDAWYQAVDIDLKSLRLVS
jgi:hypothetical protein